MGKFINMFTNVNKMIEKPLWIWERPATIHLVYTPALGAAYPLKLAHGTAYAQKLTGFFKNGMVRWICPLKELIENGIKIMPDFINEESYQKKQEKWAVLTEKLEKDVEKVFQIDLSTLSDQELLDIYTNFNSIYLDWWGYTQVVELIAYGGEELLKRCLTEEQHKKYFSILVSPTKKSASNRQEESMFDIVKLVREKSFENLEVKEKIKQHAKNFYWSQNNYYDTIILDEEYFINEAKEIVKDSVNLDEMKINNEQRLKEIKLEKEKIINELNLNEDIKKVIWILDEFSFLQDQRKEITMRADEVYDDLCKETARRKNISYTILRWAVPDQIKGLLNGNEVDVQQIKQQGEHCVVIFDQDDQKTEIYRGRDAAEKEKELLGEEINFSEITEIEGNCANAGRVEGRVRILLTPREMDKMQPGEVLVTTMTSPDFVPAMKKSSAIITDEGGITCHAAIVSRELGIPCVIGTKIATKVLKDGIKVEIKANHGLIKVIKDE
jgi:phosphohistidine swiveling domain-containing protein